MESGTASTVTEFPTNHSEPRTTDPESIDMLERLNSSLPRIVQPVEKEMVALGNSDRWRKQPGERR